jgi:hypothetical protein
MGIEVYVYAMGSIAADRRRAHVRLADDPLGDPYSGNRTLQDLADELLNTNRLVSTSALSNTSVTITSWLNDT